LGTPCDRTHSEKATSREVVDSAAFDAVDELAELAEGGLLVQAAASSARAAVTRIAGSAVIGFMAAVLRPAG
jgi:hypothetical protein